MRVLFTGASSIPGQRVLRRALDDDLYREIWCGLKTRDLPLSHPKLFKMPLDLASDFCLDEIPKPIDLVIHFGAVTHAVEENEYWKVNFWGTKRLAEQAATAGCRRFFQVSTRCAMPGGGAYGESKLAAENALKQMRWDSLLILQPAELYGGGGREGIDQMIWLASRLHLVPMLWGNRNINFAPVNVDDFVDCVCRLLRSNLDGENTITLCGPEQLNGVRLSLRLASRYRALPVPIWWPALSLLLKVGDLLGWRPVTPDQVARLVGPKAASVSSFDCRPSIRFCS